MSLFPYPLSGFITILALLVYFLVMINVNRARSRFDVPAPRMDGPEEFMRYVQVQLNTLGQLVLFLPLLWLAAITVNDGLAAALGLFWPVGRIIYARRYYRNPKKRGPGYMVSITTDFALLLVALWGIVGAFVRSFY